jgi:putative component of toxin-antitoxin plasmid stabilization module
VIVLKAAIDFVLAEHGIDICRSNWGKPLGGGLYEFRVRKAPSDSGIAGSSRPVLLRLFCTFTGNQVVVLLGGYDKGREPSRGRQQKEINRARKLLSEFNARPLA